MKACFLPLSVAAGFALAGAAAEAQTDNWYHCNISTNPDQVLMVPARGAREMGNRGYICNLLDIDYTSSYGRACYLSETFVGRSWYVYAPGTPTGWAALTCPPP